MPPCIGNHPTVEDKVMLLEEYGRSSGYKTLVETGLCNGVGSGMGVAAGIYERYTIIDFQPIQINSSKARALNGEFTNDAEVTWLCGDSAAVLPGILCSLKEPAVFWLDAHGTPWDQNFPDFPTLKEIEMIAKHRVAKKWPGHIILIDDLCMLHKEEPVAITGSCDLEELRAFADAFGIWDREDRDDMMRLVPKAG